MLKTFSLLATALLLAASPAAALTIDFEEFSHGDIVTSSQGVSITTTNTGGGPSIGVAFDTHANGTADDDLEMDGGWSVGNLAPGTRVGNVLIIQENQGGCTATSCSAPDDEGTHPDAGNFELDFSSLGSFQDFSMDLIDVESFTAEPGSVVFHLGADEVATVSFMTFLNDPTVVYGNNSANHVDVLSGVLFDRVVINMGGSGAVDNITVNNPVPEPSAALLFAIGSTTIALRVRRRTR